LNLQEHRDSSRSIATTWIEFPSVCNYT
jgi:hypothetical protein